MIKIIQVLTIIFAGACVAVADVLIKKASVDSIVFIDILRNPLIIIAIILYIVQVILFAYVFFQKWDLGIVGILQMVCYAGIVILSGILFFGEKLTLTHGLGLLLALLGVILMNI